MREVPIGEDVTEVDGAGLQPDWLEVLMDHHARLIEPVEIVVSLVHVDVLADRGRRADELHSRPSGGQHLGHVQAGPIASPVGHQYPACDRHSCQGVPSVHDVNTFARQMREVWPCPGGNDHPVGIECQHGVGVGIRGVAHITPASQLPSTSIRPAAISRFPGACRASRI